MSVAPGDLSFFSYIPSLGLLPGQLPDFALQAKVNGADLGTI